MSSVDEILDERRRQKSPGRSVFGILGSLILHGGLLAGVLLVPGLLAEPPKPIEYVPVMLVPAPAVGVETPAPRPAPPPEPTPEPPPPEPEPASDVPVLPDETKPKEPEPQPKPKPAEPRPEPPPAALPGPQGSPTGDPGSSFTQGAAVLGVEDPSFTYGYYLDRLVVAVKSQWVRPPLGSGVQGVVHFRIQEDGAIQDVRIVQSSGYNSFDLAALRAVQAAAPLPPLPRSYAKGPLGVNLIFK